MHQDNSYTHSKTQKRSHMNHRRTLQDILGNSIIPSRSKKQAHSQNSKNPTQQLSQKHRIFHNISLKNKATKNRKYYDLRLIIFLSLIIHHLPLTIGFHRLHFTSPSHFFSINQERENRIRVISNTKLTICNAFTSYSNGNPGNHNPLRTIATPTITSKNRVNTHHSQLIGTNPRP